MLSASVLAAASIGLMVLGAGAVSGQDYANKPICIVTSPAGGGGDFTSRLIAQAISGPFGETAALILLQPGKPILRKMDVANAGDGGLDHLASSELEPSPSTPIRLIIWSSQPDLNASAQAHFTFGKYSGKREKLKPINADISSLGVVG